MRILTVFGTRPEIIRLSLIIKILDQSCEHLTVYTGQNSQESLSTVFFNELQVRPPDRNLEIRAASFGAQVGQLFERFESVLDELKPDRVLVLGDTNSGLSAVVAARRRIPVYHMEAGNRCYDDRVPEEINRRIIDHASTILLPYTTRSKENLVREGIERDRIFVTGNPIFEVLTAFDPQIEASDILSELGVEPQGFFLATVHRAENVDDADRLQEIFRAFEKIAKEFEKPILVSVHPRTADRISSFKIKAGSDRIRLLDALPFFGFIKLEKNAFMVLTDSGTVQEECAIFKVPNVTIRDVTERPETIECGSNILGGTSCDSILSAVRFVASRTANWIAPDEYLVDNVSQTVCKILLGHTSLREHH